MVARFRIFALERAKEEPMHTEPAGTETADVYAAMEESGVLPRAL